MTVPPLHFPTYSKPQADAMFLKRQELQGEIQKYGLNWRGTWLPDVSYGKNDVVQRNGETWIGLRTSLGVAPALATPLDWDLFTGKGDKGDNGEVEIATDWKNLYGRNATEVTVGTAFSTIVAYVEGAVDRDTYFQVNNVAILNVTTAGVLEGWYSISNGSYSGNSARRIKQTLPVGYYTLNHTFIQRQIAGPGDFYMDFYLRFTGGAGEATILAKDCELTVISAGIVGGASNQRPNFWAEETVSFTPIDGSITLADVGTLAVQVPLAPSGTDTVSVATDATISLADNLTGTRYPRNVFFGLTISGTGSTRTLTGGYPSLTYELLIDGGLTAYIDTDASGNNTTNYGAVFSLSTGSHTIKILATGQTFTITV